MTESEQKEIFSQNLNRLIEKSGKEQKQIAFDLDEKPTTFNQWVRGKALPSVTKVHAIADYFHVSFEYLVSGIGEAATGVGQMVANALDWSFSDDERFLVEFYRELNPEGQDRLKEQLNLLLRISEYRKNISDKSKTHDENKRES